MKREEKLRLIYRHTSRDFKGRLGGMCAVLVLRPEGTCLVGMEGLSEAEIDRMLPLALNLEARRLAGKKGNGR